MFTYVLKTTVMQQCWITNVSESVPNKQIWARDSEDALRLAGNYNFH